MMATRLSVVAITCVVFLAAAPRQQPMFRAGVDLVNVDVSVRAGNNPVQGLAAKDFDLSDDGVPQEISDVSYETQPIDVTIALDVSQSVSGPLLKRLRKAVDELMGDLGAHDRLKLLVFNDRIARVVDFTADAKAVVAALEGVSASGGTSIFDAIEVALVSAKDLDRRQLLVVFSDGADGNSISDKDVLDDVARRSRATMALVLTVSEGWMNSAARFPYTALAGETGGQVVPVSTGADLTKTFRQLLSEFRSSYVLRFTPHGVEHGGYHTLAVKVGRPGKLDVRARRGYFGG